MLNWGSDDEEDPLFGSSWQPGNIFGNVDLSGVLPLVDDEDFADRDDAQSFLKRGNEEDASLQVPMGSNKLGSVFSSFFFLFFFSFSLASRVFPCLMCVFF